MDLTGDSGPTSAPVGKAVPHPVDLLWLSFFALYLTPWFTAAPPTTNWPASIAGTLLFLGIYALSYRQTRFGLLPHVVATALIGFALSPFGGVWNVFNVFAASIAARMRPRRSAYTTVGVLQAALILFGLWSGQIPVAWLSGVYFGVLAAGTTMLLDNLDQKNRQLNAAQDQIRRLSVASERERIARDLHDLLGQTLTAIALKANLAHRLAGCDQGRAATEMGEVASAAREALLEVRSAVTGIADRTLAEEVERSRSVLSSAGVIAIVEEMLPPADPQYEQALAMVLREATTNVVRHAGARQCRIQCAFTTDGGSRLSVADDGCGGVVEGFGVGGMRRRLAAMGGTLVIHSDASGSQVAAHIPGGAA